MGNIKSERQEQSALIVQFIDSNETHLMFIFYGIHIGYFIATILQISRFILAFTQ